MQHLLRFKLMLFLYCNLKKKIYEFNLFIETRAKL